MNQQQWKKDKEAALDLAAELGIYIAVGDGGWKYVAVSDRCLRPVQGWHAVRRLLEERAMRQQ